MGMGFFILLDFRFSLFHFQIFYILSSEKVLLKNRFLVVQASECSFGDFNVEFSV